MTTKRTWQENWSPLEEEDWRGKEHKGAVTPWGQSCLVLPVQRFSLRKIPWGRGAESVAPCLGEEWGREGEGRQGPPFPDEVIPHPTGPLPGEEGGSMSPSNLILMADTMTCH